ncbi:hypothetical protein VPNG_05912 [Cytospora leucostoma]|uniref:Uncharacterized protein n=1 Tax=Cytospora leucostoma TaxID=1230097 RepID=A0A423XAX0_9PEZI|nr:hypothetical protein VPNG_05912 [Cytospora leucostoma]
MTEQQRPQAASHPTSLTILESDLVHALSALRDTPAAELSAIRTLHISFNESNLLYWHGSRWPGERDAMDDDGIEENTRLYPAPASLATSSPREAFCALLRFIAEDFDLGALDLEIDASWAVHSLIDIGIAYLNYDELEQYWRFIYEWYMDLGRALGEVFAGKELRGLEEGERS